MSESSVGGQLHPPFHPLSRSRSAEAEFPRPTTRRRRIAGRYAPGVGFSPWGLVVAGAVLAPSLLLLAFPLRSDGPVPAGPLVLTWIERAGQALCLIVPVITEDGPLSWWWASVVVVLLAAYYALWCRYLVRGRRLADLYRPLWGMPVSMAVLPVLVFLASAAWLGNPWIAGAAVILAAGHVPASVLIARRYVDAPSPAAR
jgi:hypothetical protein